MFTSSYGNKRFATYFPNHIVIQYSAFKGDPKSNCHVLVGYFAFKGAQSNNCNVQVPCFTRAPNSNCIV